MKTIRFKYLTVLGIFAAFAFTGCLKDAGPGSEDYGNSSALVGFQYSGFAFVPGIASILPQPNDTFSVEVALSVSSQFLNKDVVVTVAQDQSTLTTYNADTTQSNYGTTFLQLPTAYYTIVGGGKVTIPAGKNKASFNVLLAGDKIDFTKDYAIGLKITDASGVLIATNLNDYIIIIKAKSPYAGNYLGSGIRARPTIGDQFTISGIIPFNTVTLNEIDGQLADAGSGYNMALVVHDTEPSPYPVDVVPDPLSSATPAAITQGNDNGESTYDPTTKTFDLHFSYTTSSIRVVDEKLVRQ